jgi:hypothetical protein
MQPVVTPMHPDAAGRLRRRHVGRPTVRETRQDACHAGASAGPTGSTIQPRRFHMSDHDTVVVSGGGSSAGAIILAIVVLALVIGAGWYFLMGPGAGASTNTPPGDIDVNVTLPSQQP